MNELEAIQQITRPNTRSSLAAEFNAAGLQTGMTVLVHSSLSSLGWVCGGAVAVVQALLDVVTEKGTLVMPAHSGDLSNPANWQHPPVPESWWEEIRETMPAFHPAFTPTRGMGAIPEVFRTMPGVLRSHHPTVSFAAYGRHAENIIDNHTLNHSMGVGSPLQKIYDLDGWVLLIGVGFGNNTSFHLAEDRARGSKTYQEGSPIINADGNRIWQWYEEVNWDDAPFTEIGTDFESTGAVRIGKVGLATTRLFKQKPAVDFAVSWLEKKRGISQE
jgi:aminoglycoside 3-N-acetyltransferase